MCVGRYTNAITNSITNDTHDISLRYCTAAEDFVSEDWPELDELELDELDELEEELLD